MQKEKIIGLLAEWKDEFIASLFDTHSLCIALFNIDGTLLFANDAMSLLLSENPQKSLINPSFEKLTSLDNSNVLIFNGFLTIGEFYSISSSIAVKIFRKNEKFLILGGVDAAELINQNKNMHHLNKEIGKLQRNLIKEKQLLEITLEQLNEANSKLQELNATKDKFFSIIAHDLKNPFNSILGFSDLLVVNSPNYSVEKIQKFAQNIHNVSKNTFILLENLLEWSRLQTGKLTPNLVKVDLAELSLEVQLLCEPIALSKNITLELDIDSSVFVIADKQMLHTVIINLVTNAFKFTHPGGIVKIITQNLKNEVLFIISDTGIGIEPEYLENLFSIDCELSKDGTEKEKGTGLGLILCKEFIEKQHGKIWVESKLGKGSEFKFTIPKY